MALDAERPLQVPGVVHAYAALLARDAGFRTLYLSGAGVANASLGLPDLGMTTLEDVCTDVRRISGACELPLLVDADTGWDDPGASVAALENAGAAGCHLEDQVPAKRCGHRPGKQLVSPMEMVDRLKSAIAGKSDPSFVVMARCDAVAPEGIDASIERCRAYLAAGADMIFIEALENLGDYRRVTDALDAPVLANITEFGRTPLFTAEELADAGIAIALYPLSAFRSMSHAALETYRTIRSDGTQRTCLEQMQTRDELYRHLDYHRQELQLDSSPDPS